MNVRDTLVVVVVRCLVTVCRGQEWRVHGLQMRLGVDVWVVMDSYVAHCGDGGRERVVCARGKGWYGSGGGYELAHSGRSDHAIASTTARAASRGLRLRPQGECI